MAELIAYGRKGQPQGYSGDYPVYPQAYVIAVTGGELVVENGDMRETVAAGQALVLAPGAGFRLSTPRVAYRGHFADFAPTSVDLAPRATVLGGDPALRRAVDDLEAEYRQPWPRSLLAELSTVMGLRCLRRVDAREAEGADLCARIDALLRAHLFTADHLAAILADLPCSQRHAARLYRQHRGCTIKRSQLALKCEAARELLATTEMSVTAIAMELGFPSSQHFATVFRRVQGATPSDVRLTGGTEERR